MRRRVSAGSTGTGQPSDDQRGHTDDRFRTWLANELQIRKSKNRSYSLRAFARRLDISPATLSRVLAGHRQVTAPLALRILRAMNLSELERRQLFAPMHSGGQETANETFQEIDPEDFRLIADWHYFAILGLSQVSGCRYDAAWVADQLGITKDLAREGLDRLLRLRFIVRDGYGFKPMRKRLATIPDRVDRSVQRHHAQVLERALESLETVSTFERDISSVTLAIDPDRLCKAKDMIRDFRRGLCDLLGSGQLRQVYTLSIVLFPLRGDAARAKARGD